MKALSRVGGFGLGVFIVVLATPVWLPLLGIGLAVEHPFEAGDTALVLEGTGQAALTAVEDWRRRGFVRDVVVVEAPVKTHALTVYWSDLVERGIAPPAATPAEHLRVVRSPTTQAAEQAEAALPELLALGSRTVVVPGGGGIGSRVVARDLSGVLGRRGISLRIVRSDEAGRDPGRWWQNADDRRAVLDSWLQLLVPGLGGYEVGAG